MKVREISQEFVSQTLGFLLKANAQYYPPILFPDGNYLSECLLKLTRVRVDSGYKSASSITKIVPIGRTIVPRPEPIIDASRPAMVIIFPFLLVRVWKYFVSLVSCWWYNYPPKQVLLPLDCLPVSI